MRTSPRRAVHGIVRSMLCVHLQHMGIIICVTPIIYQMINLIVPFGVRVVTLLARRMQLCGCMQMCRCVVATLYLSLSIYIERDRDIEILQLCNRAHMAHILDAHRTHVDTYQGGCTSSVASGAVCCKSVSDSFTSLDVMLQCWQLSACVVRMIGACVVHSWFNGTALLVILGFLARHYFPCQSL